MSALSSLLDFLLPPACAACRRPLAREATLCRRCDAGFTRLGTPGPAIRGLDACFAALPFDGPAVEWMHRFKYPQRGLAGLDVGSAAVMRAWIVEAARGAPQPDAVLAVPLHPRRERARGFAPAGLLARHLARARGHHFERHGLVRVRDTPSQTGLSRAERRRNLRGAFAARGAAPHVVWLVDDVVTTGATLAAAAAALRDQGAVRVYGIAVAATPLAS